MPISTPSEIEEPTPAGGWKGRADRHEALLYEVQLACSTAALAARGLAARSAFEHLAETIGRHLDEEAMLTAEAQRPPQAPEEAP